MKTLIITLSNGVELSKELSDNEARENYMWFLEAIKNNDLNDIIELDAASFRIKLIDYVGVE